MKPSNETVFTADVPEMNILGNGIVKRDGCVVFCIGAVDGDRITAKITEQKKNFQTAAVVSCEQPSVHRCEPACPVFGACGGCTLQHINYSHEIEIKRTAVASALRRAGLGQIPVEEILFAAPERYRNKAVYHFSPEGKIAYYAGGSKEYIPVADCLLCPELFAQIAADAEAFFAAAHVVPKYLYLRTNRTLSQVCVVVGIDLREAVEQYAAHVRDAFPMVCGVLVGAGNHPEDRDADLRLVSGVDYIEESFLGLTLRVSAASFFQVNTAAAELLCQKAVEMLDPSPDSYGVDLYCGTGTFGMAIAAMHPDVFVTGVEINENAVENAKENAAANGLSNVGFFCGDSADFAKNVYGGIDFALIDPPRAGCSEKMLQSLCRMHPEKIVYVSCDPGTLGRDLKKLTENGYAIKRVAACDLFPRTKHVESVVLLSKTKNNQEM